MSAYNLNTFIADTQDRNSLVGVKIKRKNLSTAPCQHPECTGFAWAQGYCGTHYQKMKKLGVIQSKRILNNPVRRYYSKIEVNPETLCWEWTGAIHPNGYPLMGIGGKQKQFKVHRFAYQMFFGDIPDGFVAMHSCDNRKCSNPAHLSLGTHKENMQDASRKGRLSGKGNLLTAPMILTLRVLYARGSHSFRTLAWIYGIDEETARRMVKAGSHLTA